MKPWNCPFCGKEANNNLEMVEGCPKCQFDREQRKLVEKRKRRKARRVEGASAR